MEIFTKQNVIIFFIVFISVTALMLNFYKLENEKKIGAGAEFVKTNSSSNYDSSQLGTTVVSSEQYSQPEMESVETYPTSESKEDADEGRLKFMPSTSIGGNNKWMNQPMTRTNSDNVNVGDAFSENKRLKDEQEVAKKDKSWLDSLPLPSFLTRDKSKAHISSDPVDLPDDELHNLARMIQAEAGGESYEGKLAVGAVILNRVKDRRFPNSVKGVISAPGQFEPYSNGRFQRVRPTSSDLKAAKEAMSGSDPTGGAVFFYAPTLTPQRWHETLTPTVTIGNHRFFK